MKRDFNEKWIEIENEFQKLPKRAQRAIYWIVEHFDFVENMAEKSDMTYEEIQKRKETAREKEDYIALALLCVAEVHQKKDPEAMEQ